MMRRFTSVAAAPAAAATLCSMQYLHSQPYVRPSPKGAPNFDDSSMYREMSAYKLFKSIIILKLCGIPWLAENSVPLMKKVAKVVGPYITYDVAVKRTIYNHFCAGENDAEVGATVRRLESKHIYSVLDYAAEADSEGFTPEPGQDEAPDVSMTSLVNNKSVRYPPDNGAFDENTKLYMMAVMHAYLHAPKNGSGVVAVKVTGMCDPQLLARKSSILMSIHQKWIHYFTRETKELKKIDECRVEVGSLQEVTYDQCIKGLQAMCPKNTTLSDAQAKELVEFIDRKKSGKVTFFDFLSRFADVATTAEAKRTPLQKILATYNPVMTDEECQLWAEISERMEKIGLMAETLNVRAMIDAEQSFYQPAIDCITIDLQKKYNIKAPVIYNTYQCYLTYAEARVRNDLARSEHAGFLWGGKIVRGAYMHQERKTAEQYKYESPIWPTYEETGKCYEATAARIFAEFERVPDRAYEVFFGTHNREALTRITQAVLDKPVVQPKTAFGQLFGMRDNLTIPLANAGFLVFKYLPYGPVKETIHYLGRRAVENSSVLASGDSDEMRMMKKELRHRFHLA